MSAASIYYHLWKQTGENIYIEKMNMMMKEALAREPGYSGLYVKLAYLSYMSGQIDQALDLQKLSITYYDSEFFNWVLLAKLYYEKGQKDQFIYAYSKAAVMNKEEFLIKNTLRAFKDAKDIRDLPFPVYFPEPN